MGWCDFSKGAARLRRYVSEKGELVCLGGDITEHLPRLYYPARLHAEDATEASARPKL